MIGRKVSLIVVACLMTALAAGCSSKKDKDVAEVEEELAVDPCTPACCCRVKENYYVRFRCSLESECEAGGGECTAKQNSKCRSSGDSAT
jgi:hypothetical protein